MEKSAEEAAAQLSKTILARYHEEQIWSDKIRRMSTWGTWGLMGVNVLLFLLFQVAVEPWRRKRLVKGFEEKVVEALGKEWPRQNQALKGGVIDEDNTRKGTIIADTAIVGGQTAEDDALVSESSVQAAAGEGHSEGVNVDVPPELGGLSMTSNTTTFERIKEKARDLFSDRQISVRQIDLTVAALGGSAASAVAAGVLVVLFHSR